MKTTPLVPAWVPPDIRARLPTEELAADRKAVRCALEQLEAALGSYVAAYDLSSQDGPIRGRRTGLCTLFEGAALTRRQLAIIRGIERVHPGIGFVAYRRPLRRRHLPS